jgi:YidC/Oxa1 family membrane protein insertase
MDQKRLMIAIAISVAILFVFQFLGPKSTRPVPPPATVAQSVAQAPAAAPAATPAAASATAVPRDVPRLAIDGARVVGSISLLGARLDDLVLRDYRDTIEKDSPLVRVLESRADPQPSYVQFGWTPAEGSNVKVPGDDTVWTPVAPVGRGSAGAMTWDNGAGLVFRIEVALDDNYMFTVKQTVANKTGAAVALYPWSRIRRDYMPVTGGYYILHEGMLGILGGTLKESTYSSAKSDGEKRGGLAFESTGTGGWAGITDKYWLTALVPDQAVEATTAFRHIAAGGDKFQVDFLDKTAVQIAPGADNTRTTRLFVGAKEVHLLNRYEAQGIPRFADAVDWGWFALITKPFFYAIDWLNGEIGNFGVAILVFTLFVKGLFFPLANKSYRSMSKMKLLGPKITALREQYKDDQGRMQQEMMQLYKAEKVNPASGCLPILIQVPVFFSLYKVIFTTIEMRQAPFFGWIHDLSVPDHTNVFNLFGLIPFDPTVIAPFLHLGAWPLLMGVTMFFQQKLNPPPPDPIQARIFQFMPLIFTFMLAGFPAGLVIYWSWNNTLTIAQQWLIMRQTKLARPSAARA